MKRLRAFLTAAFLAVAVFLGLTPSTALAGNSYGFNDVNPNDWYTTDDVLGYVTENGLMNGYGNGKFGPYETVSRAQVAQILWNMAGKPLVGAKSFSDVPDNEWYAPAVKWARAKGVISGYGDTNKFGPNDPVTREQLCLMLCNYSEKIAGVDISTESWHLAWAYGAIPIFADEYYISDWARDAVLWAQSCGVVSGIKHPNATSYEICFDPQSNAQRSQVAKMVAVFHREVIADDGRRLPVIVEHNEVMDDDGSLQCFAGAKSVSTLWCVDRMTFTVTGYDKYGDVVDEDTFDTVFWLYPGETFYIDATLENGEKIVNVKYEVTKVGGFLRQNDLDAKEPHPTLSVDTISETLDEVVEFYSDTYRYRGYITARGNGKGNYLGCTIFVFRDASGNIVDVKNVPLEIEEYDGTRLSVPYDYRITRVRDHSSVEAMAFV